MRDAITVVRGLGYHFLWVDALCIIQDSDEDWLHEASEMSFVYNNAILTLAAANSTSPDEGMFRKRDFQKLRPFQFRHVERFTGQDLQQYLDFSGDLAEELYIFPATNGVQSGVRPKGVLDTRGWILQEQLLSPRILYYGQNQIYWDCVTQSASELSPVSASLLEDTNPDETWAFRVLRRATAGSGDISRLRENIADIWFHVIQNYSARFLSNPKDKLVAIQGIIQAVERLLNVPSVAGMWEQNLWKQLIWWRKDRTTIAAPQDANTQSFGPTWSWLNADGPVLYCKAADSSELGRAFVDLVPVVRNISVTTQYEPAVAHTQSALKLSGPSFSCKLTAEDFKRTLIGRRWESLSVGTMKLGSVRWLLDRPIDSLLNLECVVIGEDDVAKELVALCLVEDETTPGQHKRVGLCQWDGLQWQVARFMGSKADKLEEKTFTIV